MVYIPTNSYQQVGISEKIARGERGAYWGEPSMGRLSSCMELHGPNQRMMCRLSWTSEANNG